MGFGKDIVKGTIAGGIVAGAVKRHEERGKYLGKEIKISEILDVDFNKVSEVKQIVKKELTTRGYGFVNTNGSEQNFYFRVIGYFGKGNLDINYKNSNTRREFVSV